MNIQNYIYLDPNILSYMYQNMSNIIDTKIFEYHGEQYMLQDFKNRQKIKREDYVASLLDRIVVFRQLFCRVNFELRIRQPLILYNCPDRKIVDFKSFYQELKKINFDLEKQGLILCRCNYCYRNPIKFIAGQIYFHEAFYEALNKYYQIQDNNQNESHFTYTFADTERDSYIKTVQLILPLKINFQRENGSFWDMMSDEKYQSLFRGSEIQGYKFKLFAINFKIMQIPIVLDQQGIYVDMEQAMQNFNQRIDQKLKQYGFKVRMIKLEIYLNEIFDFIDGGMEFWINE